jgi:energy-coupling factor transporter ATP-binding protein EcfA2
VDKDHRLRFKPERVYTVFCGHRGCGKSTELRRLKSLLHAPERFFVVFLDTLIELDINNLQYSDILMGLAKKLFDELEDASIPIDQVLLGKLQGWFAERIENHEKTKDFATEVKAGIKADAGVPFFAKLFGAITNSFKINSTYKEELRQIIKNSFSEFADSFNALIEVAEAQISYHNKGQKLLFIVDGTDRLAQEDSQRFFIADVHQLQLIESNFIYCAPIHLLYESEHIGSLFQCFVLPMIKLGDKRSEKPEGEGLACLKKMLYQRADRSLFDTGETVDYLIQYSGGNPRHLLRLLHYAFQFAEKDQYDKPAAEKAVAQLATDFRRILEAEDYALLYQIDHECDEANINSERAQRLLFNLALLEYNSFWWRSHPAIRTLMAYRKLITP